MKNIINRMLGFIEYKMTMRRLNLWKTFWVNFRSLPLSQAVKFPIYVYGKLRVISLKGEIIIQAPITRGMIQFGTKDKANYGNKISTIRNANKLIVKGKLVLFNGFTINIFQNATLVFGQNVVLGADAYVFVQTGITIGEGTRSADGLNIQDTNGHFILNIDDQSIPNCTGEINIGSYNWLAGKTRVMKGCKTPDNTIVTSESIINKDYTKTVPPYSIIGGAPAKLIRTGFRRVYNFDNEAIIRRHYNETDTLYTISTQVGVDKFCMIGDRIQ